ncbi:MAG: DMT family transporter [Planctomycetota bacterium]|jgi:drug/metabolite transporter (DMT)-like permease
MNPQHRHRFDIIATLCCLGFLTCWTIGAIQIKYLTAYLDVWTQNLARYVVACLFWMPLLGWSLAKGRVPKRLWIAAVPVAVANIIMQCLWAGAFYYAKPGFVMLLTKTSLIWVALFSIPFFVEERALLKSIYFWVGLVASIVGVGGVIAFKSDFAFDASLTGAAIGLGCSFMWAVYTILAKTAFQGIDSRICFAVITIYTVAGLGVMAFSLGAPGQCLSMDAKGWMYVIVSSVTSIAMAHVFFYVAIQRIGATIPSMTLLSAPFLTIIVSRFLFAEILTPAQWLFGIILITGAAAAIWAQRDLQNNNS